MKSPSLIAAALLLIQHCASSSSSSVAASMTDHACLGAAYLSAPPPPPRPRRARMCSMRADNDGNTHDVSCRASLESIGDGDDGSALGHVWTPSSKRRRRTRSTAAFPVPYTGTAGERLRSITRERVRLHSFVPGGVDGAVDVGIIRTFVDGWWLSLDDYWAPLYLSCIAGMSTCVGASLVFFLPKKEQQERHGRRNGDGDIDISATSTDTAAATTVVTPDLLCFSLALAGSVMVTVSVLSIGPECFRDYEHDYEAAGGAVASSSSWVIAERAFSFVLGSGLYAAASKYVFPDPDDLLRLNLERGSDDGDADGDANAAPLLLADHGNGRMGAIAGRETALQDDVYCLKMDFPAPASDVPPQRLRRAPRGGSVPSLPFVASGTNGRAALSPAAATDVAPGYAVDIGERYNRDERDGAMPIDETTRERQRAWRLATLLFVSLLFHNFPEGLAVAASSMESERLGLVVTLSILIHNIPEGIAIAVPCLAAKPDRPWLSFLLASVSGLAEPLGAFLALVALRGNGECHYGISCAIRSLDTQDVLAFVGGIMVTVAVCDLFPEAARQKALSHTPSLFEAGILTGCVVMTITEIVLQ